MRTWFITGVSAGIGRALAEHALEAGDRVVGTVREPDQAVEFAALEKGRSFSEVLDVIDNDAAVSAVVESAIAIAGPLDVVVNNAGYGLAGAVEEISDSEARHQMETNFFGPLKVLRATLPHLRSRRSGHIVNISSGAGFFGNYGLGLYNASKFALEGLSEALRAELTPLGISVSIVEPGATRTRWSGSSLLTAQAVLQDYALPSQMRSALSAMDGSQPGDPADAAAKIYDMVVVGPPRMRLMLGADALTGIQRKIAAVAEDVAHGITLLSKGTGLPRSLAPISNREA
jgi:NAD(P)-dependent dehydrogenase (short-subunit alcohol dehydrogenase family)